MTRAQDERIVETVKREESRLRAFIRRRVADPGDAEDVLQEVFYRLVEANRLLIPIDHVTGWLFRVARNHITDTFRKKRPSAFAEEPDGLLLEEILPSPDGGPEAEYLRTRLIERLAEALGELPEEQRSVFLAHEVDGLSFKEIAELTGANLNTLLSRKRYAVLHLRERLKTVYNELVHA